MDTIVIGIPQWLYTRPLRYGYRRAREAYWNSYDRRHPAAAGTGFAIQPDGTLLGVGRDAPGGARHALRTQWSETPWGGRWKKLSVDNEFHPDRVFNMKHGNSPQVWMDYTQWMIQQTLLQANAQLSNIAQPGAHFNKFRHGMNSTKTGQDILFELLKTTVDSTLRDLSKHAELQRLECSKEVADKLYKHKALKLLLITEKQSLDQLNTALNDIFKKIMDLITKWSSS